MMAACGIDECRDGVLSRTGRTISRSEILWVVTSALPLLQPDDPVLAYIPVKLSGQSQHHCYSVLRGFDAIDQ